MGMRINVNLDSDVCDELMDYADEHDLTLPEAINEALAEFFDLGIDEGGGEVGEEKP